MLKHALQYAGIGWHVFPVASVKDDGTCSCGRGGCHDAGKHPLTSNGHHAATTDEATIKRWWRVEPGANIGIASAPSGLVVLDVDVADDRGGMESLKALSAEIDLPATRTGRTGSGGLHAVYSRPEGVEPARRIRFRQGLDLIGDGYFIAPPSRHKSGKRYEWIKRVPVAVAPAQLIEAAGTRAEKQVTAYTGGRPATPALLDDARRRLREHGPSIKGQGGDQHAFRVGAILLGGYDLTWDDAIMLATEWNDMFPQNTWAPARLAEKLKNGSSYASGVRGDERANFEALQALGVSRDPLAAKTSVVTVAENADENFGAAIMKAATDLANFRQGGGTTEEVKPLFKASRRLLTKEFPPTAWLVRGLMIDGGIGLIAGEPKTAKTWAEIEIAVSIASGTPAFGEFHTGPARRVAMFMSEDGERSLRNRLRATCAAKGVDLEQVCSNIFDVCRAPLNLMDDVDLCILIASVRQINPAFVTIDPMRNVHGANEDSSTEMIEIFKRLGAVRTLTNTTISVVHHMGKRSADNRGRRAGQRARGSGAIHGALDFGLYFLDVSHDENNWSSLMESEVKSAQAAGNFRLDLEIEDDDNGEAIKAAWEVSRDSAPISADGKALSKHEQVKKNIVDVMAEIGSVTTAKVLRARCRVDWKALNAAKKELIEEGLIIDRRGKGLELEPSYLAAQRANAAMVGAREDVKEARKRAKEPL